MKFGRAKLGRILAVEREGDDRGGIWSLCLTAGARLSWGWRSRHAPAEQIRRRPGRGPGHSTVGVWGSSWPWAWGGQSWAVRVGGEEVTGRGGRRRETFQREGPWGQQVLQEEEVGGPEGRRQGWGTWDSRTPTGQHLGL